MWKIVAICGLALMAAFGSTASRVAAQTPPPREPVTQPRAAADKPAKAATHRKRKTRHAARHNRRRHAGSLQCFGYEWRAFPTRDPKGYFYTLPGGGIC